MPDLRESLQGRDLGYLRIVAELWAIDLIVTDARTTLQELITRLLTPVLVQEVIKDLPEAAQAALSDLLEHGGKIPWALFSRRHGIIREMGPGRRDRERPYILSPSAAEALWYRAIISRAFFDAPSGMEEFVFIPDDLLLLLPASSTLTKPQLGRPASQKERSFAKLAEDWILDDACTFLAAQRMGYTGDLSPYLEGCKLKDFSVSALQSILQAAGLLDDEGQPIPESVREFLEADRAGALLVLVRKWTVSSSYNELSMVPGLLMEGQIRNDPVRARSAVLDFLAQLPEDIWWSLPSFIKGIQQFYPDFQRPAGDYDSWFIKDIASGAYLRGFEQWEAVEGAFLQFILSGPMHWLGLIDLADSSDATTAPIQAFRISAQGKDLLAGESPFGLKPEDQLFFARTDGILQTSRYCPRSARYQLARFCSWEPFDGENYRYQLTPQSLAQAAKQGLKVNHLLALLRRFARNVPPNLVKSLERWELRGVEARIQQEVILKLSSPEILLALRNSPTARYLGDPLGTTAVVVKPGAIKKVLSALAEMGYLSEVDQTLLGESMTSERNQR